MTLATPDHEHFWQAALRHESDARHLGGAQRLPNADHLLGLGVECAIKSVLLQFGLLASATSGPPTWVGGPKKDKSLSHMPRTATDAAVSLAGRGSANFLSVVQAAQASYQGWDVAHRYRDGTDIASTDFGQRQTAARAVYQAAQTARISGAMI